MKIAIYRWGSWRAVGVLSMGGSEIMPLALSAGARNTGARPPIEHLAACSSMPKEAATTLPLMSPGLPSIESAPGRT
jgi:hypothetical protein